MAWLWDHKSARVRAGHGSVEAWSPGQAEDALLQAGRGRLSPDVAICQREATQHPAGFCEAGDSANLALSSQSHTCTKQQ